MRFKQWRKQAGLTLQQVERRSGIAISRLSRVERGELRLGAPEAFLLKRILILAIAQKCGERVAE